MSAGCSGPAGRGVRVLRKLAREQDGAPLLTLATSFRRLIFKDVRVTVAAAALERPDLDQLLLLSFFLRVQATPMIRRPYRTRHGDDPFARIRP